VDDISRRLVVLLCQRHGRDGFPSVRIALLRCLEELLCSGPDVLRSRADVRRAGPDLCRSRRELLRSRAELLPPELLQAQVLQDAENEVLPSPKLQELLCSRAELLCSGRADLRRSDGPHVRRADLRRSVM